MIRLLPESATADARRLLATRALRGLVDGAASVVLASYLSAIGFSPFQIGAIIAGMLGGSAILTLIAGLFADRFDRRHVLLVACALMAATGIGFAGVTAFWPLLIIAIAGTLNPSAGDVSVFLPTEQAVLSEAAAPRDRTSLFAWYNLSGAFAGALGALASSAPLAVAVAFGWDALGAQRSWFVVYAIAALPSALLYLRLTAAPSRSAATTRAPLARSRSVVLRLAALFSLDSFGGGLIVQSLLVLWLERRFALGVEKAGAIFFAAGVLGALSQLASSRLAARIGLIRTMVFTHLPSNALLVLAGVMPTAPLAVGCMLLRMALSQMDVPARQSFVMAVVPPEERAAAASVTSVPRSLAAALSPLIAGAMLERTSFGWPLICAGVLKSVYDVLLLWQFGKVVPAEEH
jgi:MFS family permease